MGSTRKFGKEVGRNADAAAYKTRLLTCGCRTDEPPILSKPDKWFCCGAYRGAKK